MRMMPERLAGSAKRLRQRSSSTLTDRRHRAVSALCVEALAICDVKLIVPPLIADGRGWFCEAYSAEALASVGIDLPFVQDNVSYSRRRGTVRGLHFQSPPDAQAKLVRVIRGRIYDVAVDLRRGSPHFGEHIVVELSDRNRAQLFIPEGFAHGFCTLESDTEVAYKVSRPYAPRADSGLFWRDPELAIQWPVEYSEAILSEKDAALPPLSSTAGYFDFNF